MRDATRQKCNHRRTEAQRRESILLLCRRCASVAASFRKPRVGPVRVRTGGCDPNHELSAGGSDRLAGESGPRHGAGRACREGPLEFVACFGGKEHESILRLEARATHIFMAMGLVA